MNELPKKPFWQRLLCPHNKGWRVMRIAWDGATTAQCLLCGKVKTQSL